MCLEAGMNDHIAKPIDPDQLFGVLLRWIRRPGGDDVAAKDGRRALFHASRSTSRCRPA
jgi:CheY-like chemotaxis protein